MAIALVTAEIRHERRVRLFFSAALAGAAFSSVDFYVLENRNGTGTTPGVAAAFVVPGATGCVELQLDHDLTPGNAYRFSAVGVPAVDASTTPDPSDAFATFGFVAEQPVFATSGDLDTLLYGEDVVFDGAEFGEDASGDLAGVTGPVNLRMALWRRALSDGLPWDGNYGAKPRSFVDGTPGALPGLRAQTEASMRQDDRVASAKATVDIDPDLPTGYVNVTITPIGSDSPLESIPVPVRTS